MSGGHSHGPSGHAGGAHRWRLQLAFARFGVEHATLQVEPATHTQCKEMTW